MNWCVYLVLCADGSYYCGSSLNAVQRLRSHAAGKGARYTRAKGVQAMRVVACCLERSAALKTEYRIKQLNRAAKAALWAGGTAVEAETVVAANSKTGSNSAEKQQQFV